MNKKSPSLNYGEHAQIKLEIKFRVSQLFKREQHN